MGSMLSPEIESIYIVYFKQMTLEKIPLKPTVFPRYIDYTFILWTPMEAGQILLDYLNTMTFALVQR